MFPKDNAYRSDKWLRAVSTLHCMSCFKEGETQAAHRNEGKGMGIKTDDCLTAALCVKCHAEIDQGAHMTKAERRDLMNVMILMTLRELCKRGLVVVK